MLGVRFFGSFAPPTELLISAAIRACGSVAEATSATVSKVEGPYGTGGVNWPMTSANAAAEADRIRPRPRPLRARERRTGRIRTGFSTRWYVMNARPSAPSAKIRFVLTEGSRTNAAGQIIRTGQCHR